MFEKKRALAIAVMTLGLLCGGCRITSQAPQPPPCDAAETASLWIPSILTPQNTPVTIPGLSGLSMVGTQPTHGTLSESDGTVTYTPEAGFIGPDSFSLVVQPMACYYADAEVIAITVVPSFEINPDSTLTFTPVTISFQPVPANGYGPSSYSLIVEGPSDASGSGSSERISLYWNPQLVSSYSFDALWPLSRSPNSLPSDEEFVQTSSDIYFHWIPGNDPNALDSTPLYSVAIQFPGSGQSWGNQTVSVNIQMEFQDGGLLDFNVNAALATVPNKP